MVVALGLLFPTPGLEGVERQEEAEGSHDQIPDNGPGIEDAARELGHLFNRRDRHREGLHEGAHMPGKKAQQSGHEKEGDNGEGHDGRRHLMACHRGAKSSEGEEKHSDEQEKQIGARIGTGSTGRTGTGTGTCCYATRNNSSRRNYYTNNRRFKQPRRNKHFG